MTLLFYILHLYCYSYYIECLLQHRRDLSKQIISLLSYPHLSGSTHTNSKTLTWVRGIWFFFHIFIVFFQWCIHQLGCCSRCLQSNPILILRTEYVKVKDLEALLKAKLGDPFFLETENLTFFFWHSYSRWIIYRRLPVKPRLSL